MNRNTFFNRSISHITRTFYKLTWAACDRPSEADVGVAVGSPSITLASVGVLGVALASVSIIASGIVPVGVEVGVCIVGKGGGAGLLVLSTADAMVLHFLTVAPALPFPFS